MNQKGSSNILVVVAVLIIIVGIAGYLALSKARPTETLSLSADGKSITTNDSVLLTIDNDTIFNWFKSESQLCDESNISTTPERKEFCENKASFKNQTKFASIIVSPDKTIIGFDIESETLSPDKVVGIFSLQSNKVTLLTNYYLGNKFIGFSPKGKYFVHQSNCWEGLCGLYIKESTTLQEKASVNNPEYLDLRSANAEFIKWLSENEIEYKIGADLIKYELIEANLSPVTIKGEYKKYAGKTLEIKGTINESTCEAKTPQCFSGKQMADIESITVVD